jgi:hypothetical protein
LARRKTSISKEFIFENYPSVVPGDENQSGYVNLPGICLFPNLVTPSQYENNEPTYNCSLRFAKDTEHAARLFWTVDHIARKVWPDNADEHLEEIFGAIGQGVSARRSPISLQDGDINKPEYNAGSWVLKASVRESQGEPRILGKDLEPIEFAAGEVVSGDASQVPKQFDLVVLGIKVWGMKKFDRINFGLEAVRYIGKSPAGAPKMSLSQAQDLLTIEDSVLQELTALASREEPEEPKKLPAPRKKAPKKAAKKSVFR